MLDAQDPHSTNQKLEADNEKQPSFDLEPNSISDENAKNVHSHPSKKPPIKAFYSASQYHYSGGINACTSIALSAADIFLSLQDEGNNESSSLLPNYCYKYLLPLCVKRGAQLNKKVSKKLDNSYGFRNVKDIKKAESAKDVVNAERESVLNNLDLRRDDTIFLDSQQNVTLSLEGSLDFLLNPQDEEQHEDSNTAYIMTARNHTTTFIQKGSLYFFIDSLTERGSTLEIYDNRESLTQKLKETWRILEATQVDISPCQNTPGRENWNQTDLQYTAASTLLRQNHSLTSADLVEIAQTNKEHQDVCDRIFETPKLWQECWRDTIDDFTNKPNIPHKDRMIHLWKGLTEVLQALFTPKKNYRKQLTQENIDTLLDTEDANFQKYFAEEQQNTDTKTNAPDNSPTSTSSTKAMLSAQAGVTTSAKGPAKSDKEPSKPASLSQKNGPHTPNSNTPTSKKVGGNQYILHAQTHTPSIEETPEIMNLVWELGCADYLSTDFLSNR